MREKIIVDSLTNEGVTAKLTGFGALFVFAGCAKAALSKQLEYRGNECEAYEFIRKFCFCNEVARRVSCII